MKNDRSKWDRKYRSAGGDETPSPVVVQFAPHARIGRALDIAAGRGRNSLFLAGLGFSVDAVDISPVGLRSIAHVPNVRPVCADLDQFDIPPKTYNLIVNINFLQRRLIPQIVEALKPGGMMIFETYMIGTPAPDGRPHNREYLLRPNELLRAFLQLRILYYTESESDSSLKATLVGRLP